MNQKGEVTLVASLLIFLLLGIVLICSIELKHSFNHLKRRTDLFLCVKEAKGELNQFITSIGKTNWAIKNLNRSEIILMLLPAGMVGANNLEKLKKVIIHSQDLKLFNYLKTLNDLRKKGCQLDPRMFMTPFEMNLTTFKRDINQAVTLRRNEWSYAFYKMPYLIKLKINGREWEKLTPDINYYSEEKTVKLSLTSRVYY